MPTSSAIRTVPAAVALTLLLGACGSSSKSSTPAAQSASGGQSSASAAGVGGRSGAASGKAVEVKINGYAYQPANLTLKAGTRVTFFNGDATAHTATATSPRLDTGTIKPAQRVTVVLTQPGSYSYICQFHAFMRGALTVTR